jgi:hypothetical protein
VDVSDLAKAGKHALERAKRRKERLDGKTGEVKEVLDRLLLEIADLEEHIAIPNSVNDLVSKAKKSLKDNDFDESMNLVTTCSHKLDKLRKGSKPKIELKFDVVNLQPGLWNRTQISIMNNGLAAAKDIQVKISGPLEVRRFPMMDKLTYNDAKSFEIGLKPDSAGSVPVDIDIRCIRTWDGESFTEHVESWLEVDHTTLTSKPQENAPRSHLIPVKQIIEEPGTEKIDCIYCEKLIERSAPIFKCDCKTIYHLECVNEIESCVICGAHIREQLQVVRGAGDTENESNDIEWE